VTADATLAPIAQAWRIFGIASLTGRHRALLERAKHRPLSAAEKAEARQIATALEELQALEHGRREVSVPQ
jgi:hypothetical protein